MFVSRSTEIVCISGTARRTSGSAARPARARSTGARARLRGRPTSARSRRSRRRWERPAFPYMRRWRSTALSPAREGFAMPDAFGRLVDGRDGRDKGEPASQDADVADDSPAAPARLRRLLRPKAHREPRWPVRGMGAFRRRSAQAGATNRIGPLSAAAATRPRERAGRGTRAMRPGPARGSRCRARWGCTSGGPDRRRSCAGAA